MSLLDPYGAFIFANSNADTLQDASENDLMIYTSGRKFLIGIESNTSILSMTNDLVQFNATETIFPKISGFSNANIVSLSASNSSFSNIFAKYTFMSNTDVKNANILSANTSNLSAINFSCYNFAASNFSFSSMQVDNMQNNYTSFSNSYGCNLSASNSFFNILSTSNAFLSNVYVSSLVASNASLCNGSFLNFTGENGILKLCAFSNAQGSNLNVNQISMLSASCSNLYSTNQSVENLYGNNIYGSNASFSNMYGNVFGNIFSDFVSGSNGTFSNINADVFTFSNGVGSKMSFSNGFGSNLAIVQMNATNAQFSNLYSFNTTLCNLTVNGTATFCNEMVTNMSVLNLQALNSSFSNIDVKTLKINGVNVQSDYYTTGIVSTSNDSLLLKSKTTDFILCTSNGIGIGTEPVYNLDVFGNINFSGNLLQNGQIYSPNIVYSNVVYSNIVTYSNIVYSNIVYSNVVYSDTNQINLNTIGSSFQNIVSSTVYASNIVSSGFVLTPNGNIPLSSPSIPSTFIAPTLLSTNIGIGIATPLYPLHVATANSDGISASFANPIIVNQVLQTSDSRTKKNCVSVDVEYAKSVIEKLNVINFEYIEKHKNKRTGFLAQEIETVFPECIVDIEEYIPNIYQNASFSRSKGTVVFDGILQQKFYNSPIKIFIGSDVHVLECTGSSVVNNKTILYVRNNGSCLSEEDERVFVYGQLVKDFKVMSYEPIIAILVKVVQSLIHSD